MAFLIVWFVGDAANLVGGLWAQLVPVVLAIAIYFCIADGVLISQCLYYNMRNARREQRRNSVESTLESPTPTTPLLGRRFSDELSITGSRRRRSSASQRDLMQRRASHPDSTLAKIVEESESGAKAWFKNVLSVVAIAVIGAVGWAIAWQMGLWRPVPVSHNGEDGPMAPGAQVLGYFSAICYLGYVIFRVTVKLLLTVHRARLPQIYKNYSEKSCEGLSLLFFVLSLLGNLTYGAGVSHVSSNGLISVTDYYPPDYRSLHRKRIHYKKPSLANRIFGHYGGRHCYFHTIPHLRATSS